MVTTNQELVGFFNAASSYLRIDGEKAGEKGEKHFTYALRRMMSRCKPLVVAYQETLEDINIDTASVEPDRTSDGKQNPRANLLIKDVRWVRTSPQELEQYERTKAQEQERIRRIRELLHLKIEVEPYIATAVPATLTDGEREAFAGFVLAETETGD